MVAEIIINSIAKDLNKTFDYIIPKNLVSEVKIGTRVFVPFGNKKLQEGIIIDIKETSEFAIKEIIKIEDNILKKDNIELAKLMSRRYFCNISDCIKLMLPPGNKTNILSNRTLEKTEHFVILKKELNEIELDIQNKTIKSEKQIKILEFLKMNNNISIYDLETITETSRGIIKTLEKNGYLEIINQQVDRNPFINKKIKKDEKLKLTKEQQVAYNKINIDSYKEFLLFGITGSRKNGNIFAINTRKTKRR